MVITFKVVPGPILCKALWPDFTDLHNCDSRVVLLNEAATPLSPPAIILPTATKARSRYLPSLRSSIAMKSAKNSIHVEMRTSVRITRFIVNDVHMTIFLMPVDTLWYPHESGNDRRFSSLTQEPTAIWSCE